MIIKLLIIGFGGFLGAICRYFITSFIEKQIYFRNFPFSTLIVNFLGSVGLGFLSVFLVQELKNEYHFFIKIGFLASFTTFSTFSFDTLNYIEKQNYILALVNILANIILGFLGAYAGKNSYRFFLD